MASFSASVVPMNVKLKVPKRFNCSPVPPKAADVIEALIKRPQTTPCRRFHGVRPQTTGCGEERRPDTRPVRPHTTKPRSTSTTSTLDEENFKRSCLYVRKRLHDIRLTRRHNMLEQPADEDKHVAENSQIDKKKETNNRRVSFFASDHKNKLKFIRKFETVDVTEEEQLEREEKLKLRHKRMTKLVWWFRVFRAICELAHDMKNLSMAITENTILSQVYVYNACGYHGFLEADQALFFDKSEFSRRKTMLFPVWAQKLAILSPENRTNSDIRQIRALMLMMKSFREKFKEAIQYKMAKVAMYINCEKGRVILRQGHWGLNFYFIYSGSVFVQKEMQDSVTKETRVHTENIIRAGESFGEIAILGDGKRTASIICREPTEVFQVDKNTFIETCWEIFEAELEDKLKFAQSFEIFQGWVEENFRKLCFMSHSVYIPMGKIIEADWSKSIYSYFVMQGRISLMREFDISGLSGAGDVSLAGMMDKPLFVPDPRLDKYGGDRPKRYANVGELHAGGHNDLRALLCDKDIPMDTLSMVSEGVKVLRVENRLIKWLGPMAEIDDYLRKRYVSFRVPPDTRLCQRYVEETNWDDFKAKTLGVVSGLGDSRDVAMMPVTSKGSSGWSRWPGSGVYRPTGTAFHSPREHHEQMAEFLTKTKSIAKQPKKQRYLLRRDTIGVPLEMRRTSLFPRSRIQKEILRTVDPDSITNDRSLMMLPTRPNLAKQRLRCLTTREANCTS